MSDEVREAGTKRSSVQDGGICASKDGCQEVQNSCFFAYLDILGFKNVVKQNTFDQMKKIVENFTVDCARSVDKSRGFENNNGDVENRIRLGNGINVRIVSDAIYVWTQNDERLFQFDDLFRIVNALLASGLECGLPLRGVVTFGELFVGRVSVPTDIPIDFSFDNGSVYGRALVEAYELESRMDWSGAILTPKAWAKILGAFEKGKRFKDDRTMRSAAIKCPTYLFNEVPYFLWTDVPFRDGKRKAIAFNWNYRTGQELSAEKIRKAFIKECSVAEDSVKLKLCETLRFYEYTQRVAELSYFGSVRMLPTPDSSYILADLNNH